VNAVLTPHCNVWGKNQNTADDCGKTAPMTSKRTMQPPRTTQGLHLVQISLKISEAFFGYLTGKNRSFFGAVFQPFWIFHAFNNHPTVWPSAMDVALVETKKTSDVRFELAITVLALFASEAKLFFPRFLPIKCMEKICFQYGCRTVAFKNNLKKHFLDNIFI
jgi:hypothetical protein